MGEIEKPGLPPPSMNNYKDNFLNTLLDIYKESFNDVKDFNIDSILHDKKVMKSALLLTLTALLVLKR